MKRFFPAIFIAFICFSLLSPAFFAKAVSPFPSYLPVINKSAALHIWTAGPATKIQPTTHPGSGNQIALEGARGSYESYQLIVSAQAALSAVNVTAGALSDGAGHTIPSANLVFFREAFIDFTGVVENEPGNQPAPKSSPTNDPRVPDPLIPFIDPYTPGRAVGAPFSVAAGLNQPVWLDVYIPASAAAGSYTGMLTVTASQFTPVDIPITVTVWNLTLPDMNSLTTYFGMHVDPLIDYHSGISACSGSSCWIDGSARARTIVKRYEELLHQHRASTWQNFVPDPQPATCTPPTNWSAYDAALQPYLDGSYWADGVPSPWIDMPFSPGVTWGPEGSCTQAQYTSLASAWAAHLKARGWFNKALVYAEDEPDASDYARIALHSQWLQAGDAGWKAHVMDTTPPSPSNVATLNPALGIYTVALSGYDHWAHDSSMDPALVAYGRSQWPSLFAQGTQLWFYESNAQSAPYPTFAANTLLGAEPQIMLWGAWYEQASGFLLWDTTAWVASNPWGQNAAWGKSGDGVLVYPGNHDGKLAPAGSPADVAIDGPIPSYRLKMVRAGLQDWALFHLAEQRGLGAYARAQVAQVYGQLGGCEWQGCPPKVNGVFFWKTDEALMQQARHNIALEISKTY
jgi:hypothetical protein